MPAKDFAHSKRFYTALGFKMPEGWGGTAGTFLVTIAFNVPLNNSLAAVAPGDLDCPQKWADYLSPWTAWNHVRTAAAPAAAGSFTIALSSTAAAGG